MHKNIKYTIRHIVPENINLNAKIKQTKQLLQIAQNADELFDQMKYTEAETEYLKILNEHSESIYALYKLSIINPMYNMVLVQGGSFMMGSEDGENDEQPIHKVILSSFEISKYETTNAQYAKFLNEYGSTTVKAGEYQGKDMIYESSIKIANKNGKQ